MNLKYTYSFSDIGLVPIYCSDIKSRDDVDTSMNFLGFDISLPLVVAPMETVVGTDLCLELSRLSGIACLPRSNDITKDRTLYTSTKMEMIPSFSAQQIKEDHIYFDPDDPVICLDTANGFNSHIGKIIKKFKQYRSNIKVISGNVGSIEGYKYLAECGTDAIRCGIGGGAGCSTSLKTSVGSGIFSLIREIANWKSLNGEGPLIIADGGIHSSREIVLSIAAGADICMAGKMFAAAQESPGQIVKYNNKLYKPYAGQASKAVKRSNKYIEGDDTLIPFQGNLSQIWSKLNDGIKSACSYMGCKTINELRHLPDECFCILSTGSKKEKEIYS